MQTALRPRLATAALMLLPLAALLAVQAAHAQVRDFDHGGDRGASFRPDRRAWAIDVVPDGSRWRLDGRA